MNKRTIKSQIYAATSFILIVVLLLWLSREITWYRHLIADLGYFYSFTNYFVNTLAFTGSGYNVYQPGALLFFFVTGLPLFIQNNFITYLYSFFVVITLVIIGLALIYAKYAGHKSLYIYAILLLSTGPLIFFRFDLFVVFLVISALVVWKSKKRALGYFVLGVATSVKIYPVVILPYLLMFDKSWRSKFKAFGCFAFGLIIPIFVIMIFFQTSTMEIINAYNYHSLKSVDIGSLFGTILSILLPALTGNWVGVEGDYGIIGLNRANILLPLWIYNYFWIIPLGLIYLAIFHRFRINEEFRIEIVLLILLTFVTFSKVFAPQYYLWYLYLIPLVGFKTLIASNWWRSILFLSILVNLSLVYIYPLNYDHFITFFINGEYPDLIVIQITRYLILLTLIVLFLNKYVLVRLPTNHKLNQG